MRQMTGKDLAGWRVEKWFQLNLSTDDRGGYDVAGYFTDKDLASATGKGKAWYGGDGTVEEVLVLTDDGKSGYIVSANPIALNDQEELRKVAIAKAKGKLTAEDKKLLGLE